MWWPIPVILYIILLIFAPVAEYLYLGTVNAFLRITYWMLFLQGIYYLLELLHVDDKTIERYLNIIFAPSVSVLCYWLVGSALEWEIMASAWFLDIFTHGINVFALALVVIFHRPCIRSNVLWAYIVPVVYLAVAYIYTYATNRLIYPSNFFSFEEIDGHPSYAWVGIIVLVIPTGLAHGVFYVISRHMSSIYEKCPSEESV